MSAISGEVTKLQRSEMRLVHPQRGVGRPIVEECSIVCVPTTASTSITGDELFSSPHQSQCRSSMMTQPMPPQANLLHDPGRTGCRSRDRQALWDRAVPRVSLGPIPRKSKTSGQRIEAVKPGSITDHPPRDAPPRDLRISFFAGGNAGRTDEAIPRPAARSLTRNRCAKAPRARGHVLSTGRLPQI